VRVLSRHLLRLEYMGLKKRLAEHQASLRKATKLAFAELIAPVPPGSPKGTVTRVVHRRSVASSCVTQASQRTEITGIGWQVCELALEIRRVPDPCEDVPRNTPRVMTRF
jgi:hypothetical protein